MFPSLLLATALLVPTVTPDVTVPVVAGKHWSVQTGVKDSLYTGQFYVPSLEPKRKCIVKRESNGHYFSTNRRGGYFGAYQMTAPLAVGAGWMMRAELRRLYGFKTGTEIARELRATPAHKWHRFYQDMAFYTIANWNGTGTGLKHWRGGRFHC